MKLDFVSLDINGLELYIMYKYSTNITNVGSLLLGLILVRALVQAQVQVPFWVQVPISVPVPVVVVGIAYFALMLHFTCWLIFTPPFLSSVRI